MFNKLFFQILVLSVLVRIDLCAQATVLLKLEVEVADQDAPPDHIFLRGNHTILGNWAPDAVRLQKISQRRWGGILLFNKGEELRFVLEETRGQNTSDTINHTVTRDTTLKVLFRSGKGLDEVPKQGSLHRLPGTVEEQLIQRLVTVRTPVGYEEDTSRSYPVVFFQDGQYVFGTGVSNKNHWLLAKTLDSLEHVDAIEPFITVVIDHEWSNRSLEYSDSDLGERYAHYLGKTLPEKIDLLFRTKDSAQHRYLAGAVAGGFIGTWTAHLYPNTFQNLILLSPAFLIHDNDIFHTLSKDSLWRNDLHIFMDVGEFGMDEDLVKGCDSIHQVWTERGLDVRYQKVMNSIPDGENFRWRIVEGLIHFFGKQKS